MSCSVLPNLSLGPLAISKTAWNVALVSMVSVPATELASSRSLRGPPLGPELNKLNIHVELNELNMHYRTPENCATLESMSGRHVTTGKAADALGVSLTTLQRWAHQGLVTPALRTAGGHFRWDIDDLRGQLRAMDRTAQHDVTKPEPQPVVAAIVTSEHGVLVGRRNDGNPPWTFIAGEI